ncbi:MAG: hypothetical protein KGJ13_10260 [Patescibacteria group bacterium]|nr:hypothetical protein [Patescibacteria group bacterium]
MSIPSKSKWVPGAVLHAARIDEDPCDLTCSECAKLEKVVIQSFISELCRRAEANMLKTGKLEGAHYAAMQSILKEYD